MLVTMTTKDVLQKPTATIHSANMYTVTERKLMNLCLHQGKQDQFKSEKYRLPIHTITTFLDTNEIKNLVWLQDAIEGLVGTTITWNILNVDRSQGWGVCTVLSGGIVNKGWIEYVFNPVFVEKLKTYKLWAELHLFVLAKLKKKHSVAIYEYGQELLARHKTDQKSDTLLLDDILALLGLKVDYKTLNRDVLKPVSSEVNKKSDLDFSYTGIRTGRKVTAVELKFQRKRQFQLPLDIPPFDSLNSSKTEDNENDMRAKLVSKLTTFGVAMHQAEHITQEYDIDRIVENIDYVATQLTKESVKIKNMAAYLVKAIQEDYRPQKSEEERIKKLKAEWNSLREKRAFAAYKALVSQEQAKLKARFLDRIEQEKGLLYRQFKTRGFDNRMVQQAFFNHELLAFLSEKEELNFEYFKTWKRRADLSP